MEEESVKGVEWRRNRLIYSLLLSFSTSLLSNKLIDQILNHPLTTAPGLGFPVAECGGGDFPPQPLNSGRYRGFARATILCIIPFAVSFTR